MNVMPINSEPDGMPIGGLGRVCAAIAILSGMPIVVERAVVQQVDHPGLSAIPLIRSPIRFLGRFENPPINPSPVRGQQIAEILRDLLSYSIAEANTLIKGVAVAVNRS